MVWLEPRLKASRDTVLIVNNLSHCPIVYLLSAPVFCIQILFHFPRGSATTTMTVDLRVCVAAAGAFRNLTIAGGAAACEHMAK